MKAIKSDIKDIVKSVGGINVTLAKQEENLKEHMRRTELAENRLEHIENGLEPIKAHINKVTGGLRLFSIIALVISIVIGITKLL